MQLRTRSRALLLALALALPGGAAAQDVSIGFDPRTGDTWVDSWLADINRYGGAYRDPFVDEMERYHGAPRELVVDLLDRPGWSPGDVYFACRLAAATGRPCRYVADEYERERGEGWGALAQRLGIKPGSAEFHQLKRGFVSTYDRLGRPIRLDADLAREFPGRGAGPGRPKGSGPEGKPSKPAKAVGDRPGKGPPKSREASGGGESEAARGDDGDRARGKPAREESAGKKGAASSKGDKGAKGGGGKPGKGGTGRGGD